jgi:RNA polymerase sigma-70 factor (ECF subfamily)
MRSDHPLWQSYVESRDKWPSIVIAFDVYHRFCARALAHAGGPNDSHHASDLYLCAACSVRNPEAIKALERGAMATARAAIARIDNDPEFIRETLQELAVKLLVGPDAKIQDYAGSGPLEAWLRVVATRTALDRLRKQRDGDAHWLERSHPPSENTSLESSLTRARFGEDFQRALLQAIGDLSPLERNVLRMHTVGRCSIDQIGRAYGVHRATAARWLDRAKVAVFQAVHQEFVGRRRLTESEFRNVASLLCDELRLGFSMDGDRLRSTAALVEPSVGSVDV